MSRLDLALEHFQAALENLEKAVEGGAPRPEPAEHQRITALEAEREALLTRIAGLEDELATLSGITQDVETRLDGAIGEIRAALART